MSDERLERYAELAVRVGANVSRGNRCSSRGWWSTPSWYVRSTGSRIAPARSTSTSSTGTSTTGTR